MATLTQQFCWQHCEKFTPIVYISRKQSAQHPLSISLSLSVGRNNNSSSISITTKRECESVHVREQRESEQSQNNAWVAVSAFALFGTHKQKHWQSAAKRCVAASLASVCVSLCLSSLSLSLWMWLTCAHQLWLLRRQFARKFKFVYSWFCGASCEKRRDVQRSAASPSRHAHLLPRSGNNKRQCAINA